jgi:hypothetical protein
LPKLIDKFGLALYKSFINSSEIRLFPGKWRPHYPFEQIAWIRPPWHSQDYLWLDFPEALFANGALYYLSHVNPKYPARHDNLPPVPWQTHHGELQFERTLPDGVRFGGRIARQNDDIVTLTLFIENASETPLRDIRVQTCAYLRALREFSAYTNDNKFIHTPTGWVTLTNAFAMTDELGTWRVGWRGGKWIADLPVIVCQSDDSLRAIAMTWFADTFNLTGNADHPCLHADPAFHDLVPGERAEVRGAIFFYEGELDSVWSRLEGR